ncbi:fatty-acid-binding protein 3, chloroplastic isoform X2 [Andrographis paniculata]|uniref:fatty-acid-binding protein 3, chloroplastic isoform X2 n=1 Tax=Andrographis paniculata TaxID=175694 RepID=UPI0021E936B0|nr:fatty-acid-binding protein 3, chloroplastic isoform X2 [Andrographis paniculata]
MASPVVATISTPLPHSSPAKSKAFCAFLNSRCSEKFSTIPPSVLRTHTDRSVLRLSTFSPNVFAKRIARFHILKATSVVNSEYTEEPETKVKFQTSVSLPGCSSPLSLLGTGYREKVFAIIKVKVYAAALYTNPSIFGKLDPWKGHSSEELEQDSSLSTAILQAPLEKSLQIVLVRDIDGKTFWGALDEAISPRISSLTSADKSAISTFRGVFQGRPLNKGTFIFLTWLDTTKMLVCLMCFLEVHQFLLH